MFQTQEEMVNMIFILGECNKNCFLASRVYAARYPHRAHPNERAFQKVLRRFTTTGSVNRARRVRNKPVLNENNELLVLEAVLENPNTSIRDISRNHDISTRSVHRVLQKYNFRPFKIQLHQELNPQDFHARQDFCMWAINNIEQEESFLMRILFSDEATFHRNGHVNRHNYHYYADENPHVVRMTNYQQRWSLNVWGGILGEHLLGPYFIEGHLNGNSYLRFLHDDLDDLLENVPLAALRQIVFQHDGAPTHNSRVVREFLDEMFPDSWIGRGGPVRWPPRSPDLTPLDFFLWGHIKNEVYRTVPTTVEDMRERIRAAFRGISPEVLRAVSRACESRLRLCLQQEGRHFEHLV